jgi:F0F1-type ATP synthase assembly protein I
MEDMSQKNRPEQRATSRSSWGDFSRLLSLGIEFVCCIVVGGALGLWFDTELNTHHWGLFTGLFLGISAAFRRLFRISGSMAGLHEHDDD